MLNVLLAGTFVACMQHCIINLLYALILVFYYLLLVHYLLAVDHIPDSVDDGRFLQGTAKKEELASISESPVHSGTKTNHEHVIVDGNPSHSKSHYSEEKPFRR